MMAKVSDWQGRVVWITGASSGIGLALARLMQRNGATVIGSDIRAPQRNEAFEHIALDVRDETAFRVTADRVRAQYGAIDVLVNNAGVGVGGETQDIGTKAWRHILDVNVLGTVHGINAVYPEMIARGSGHIVNVASVAGIVPLPGEIPYVASKFAVMGLSQTLRIEARALGINVTTVCPGKIETPIYETSPIVGYDKNKVLALWPQGITAEQCAQEMFAAIQANRATIVITRFGKLLSFAQRVSPWLMQQVLSEYMKRMRALRDHVQVERHVEISKSEVSHAI